MVSSGDGTPSYFCCSPTNVLPFTHAYVVAGVCWYQFYIYEHALDGVNTTFNFDNFLSVNAVVNATDLNNNVLTQYLLAFIPTNPYVRETWLAAGEWVSCVGRSHGLL